MNTGALVAAPAEGQSQAAAASKPNKKQAAKCNARPTCLDGLWQILKCAEELRNQQPQVLALAVQALATMWQVCTLD